MPCKWNIGGYCSRPTLNVHIYILIRDGDPFCAFPAHLHLQIHMPTSSLSSYLAASAKSGVTLFRQIMTLRGKPCRYRSNVYGPWHSANLRKPPCIFMAYDRIVPKPKPSQLSQSPLMPGHLGQTCTGQRHDMLLSPRCCWEFEQQSKWLQLFVLLLWL